MYWQLILLCVFTAPLMASGDEVALRYHESLPAIDRQKALVAIQCLRAGREKLVTGVYLATGRTARRVGEEEAYSGELEWTSVFDYGAQCLFFSRKEPLIVVEDETGNGSTTTTWEVLDARSILRPDVVYDWNAFVSTQVQIRSPGEGPVPLSKPIDIRSVGLTTSNVLALREGLDAVLAGFGYLELTSVEESPQEVRLTFAIDRGPLVVERLLVLNKSLDFAPTRYIISHVRKVDGSDTVSRRSISDCDCMWDRINHVVVPTSMVARQSIADGASLTYDVGFSWESVNTPVPDTRFAPEALEPGYAKVVDFRQATPTQVGMIRTTPAPLPGGRLQQIGWPTRILIGVHILAFVLIVIHLCRRHFRRSGGTSK
ncbi:MAG: hypothetical protein RIK87_00750 [Fuerstiella sp.]